MQLRIIFFVMFFFSLFTALHSAPKDFQKHFLFNYMQDKTVEFYGHVCYAKDENSPECGEDAVYVPIRVVMVYHGKTVVFRGKTDKNGNFSIKIPTGIPFRFGVLNKKLNPHKFVWYIKKNPGIPIGVMKYGKEW